MTIYKSLHLKWRPKSFKSFVGHIDIISIILSSLDKHKIHSSYLFYGPRGVGKTTLARLFSKGLNCITGISSNPCCCCINCLSIDNGKALDVIEIDAASRTKVEDTRDLLDNIYYLPLSMRYKIYIIDEVHMLSKHSFNALLKTLEEPPLFIKFILATTELHKIPDTILSRCMSFYLRPFKSFDIFKYLQFVVNKEKFFFDINALKIISSVSNGSIRDALILLDQLWMLNKNNYVSLKDVNIFLGRLDSKIVVIFLHYIILKKKIKVFRLLKFFSFKDIDYNDFLISLLYFIHNIYILNMFPNVFKNKVLNISYENFIILLDLSKLISSKDIEFYYSNFNKCRCSMLNTFSKKIDFEFSVFCALSYKNDFF